ncbi:MAG: DUF4810 domain-containing protein [Candidatus Binatia bacterium]
MSGVQPHAAPAKWCQAQCWLLLTIVFTCGALASGCAARPLYDWGRYEEGLKASYETHDDASAYSSLEATITSARQTGHRIPPGVCAEYGFLLYKRGQRESAIEYFQQEAQLFPESKPLMDKLVAKVREQAAGNTQPPAGGGSLQ